MAALQTAALLLLLVLAVASEAAEPPQQERTALQEFLLGTPHERSLGWNSPSAPSACLWFGVTCDAANATVVAVRLPGVGLVGDFPAGTLGKLTSLHTLSLRSNRLFGAVPGDIFSLLNLHSLYLQNNRLSGAVPPELAGLTALRHLALYDNEFSGEIPAALDGLAELRSIRLDGNRLSGSIPSLSGLRRLEVFNVSENQLDGAIPAFLARFPPESFAGNPGLCGEPLDSPCPVSSRKKKGLSGAAIAAIAVGAAAAALLALVLLVLCFVRRRRDAAATGDNNGNKATSTPTQDRGFTPSPVSGEMTDLADLTSSKDLVPSAGETTTRRLVFVGAGAGGYSFDLEDLLRASAEVLGKGSAGTTYRAVLEDGATVVVKRLKDVVAARREFASALEALGRVEHRNLLPVRAYYFSKDEKLLVADYLPAGSLAAALHGSRGSGQTPMDWDARARAALCAARGMAHLHAAHGLVHGDVKSSNLLLRHGGDPDNAAALSDYSLQHLFAPLPPSARAGGYHALELVDPRRPTFSSDVYSLGVLFLEILTGKCPASGTAGVDGGGVALDLPRWVQSVVREEWTAEVFDQELVRLGGGAEEEMVALLQVAMACAATMPDARPEATEVLKRVEEIGGGRHGRATTEEEGSWGTPTGASP
ncbi:probable inactive receptor kinase At2g26730 [Lolium perenne]|nr:probable inactive receptor kinase At2g26730 [Lolium perenne]